MWQAKNLISSWFWGALAVFIIMFGTARQEVNRIVLEFNPLVIYSLICALVLFPIVHYRWYRIFKVWHTKSKEAPSEPRPDDEQIIQDSGHTWSVAAKRTKPKPTPSVLTPQVEQKDSMMDDVINFFKNIVVALFFVPLSPIFCVIFWWRDRQAGDQH
ncbi:hypothetical protein [Lactiplantibacillus mudanjiangensis]|uniref:Uncharacterized protein n=1 Tax=Lactiplantibacillus mudanjiangensis TaxID=1296538 RepID=A0A660DVL1_9LACO|nr:hypothetical protein [Lactiplantibacillus mudanjiangensis]VDG20059.1 hypothetical protein [Lactobacillus sp. CBA3605] [Lactiplantibacillus mudanjiangensis]VDG26218.1 hypothetical protein [Lactobacillus sp. CBA3605] [Lactiplantibacillus mudanjiangensis]VDG27375.1 hypothetical protein [Lactobacillus sp. CBA3605] [Lactiplantibacillus mudanjiangensis]VDG33457.1 hypothetical protein [Lactobacillus sp. CBA3605] [Lactiplantibacillus mudanjiangensis]